MQYAQGEIYHADLGDIDTNAIEGHEQGGKRPVVIVKVLGDNMVLIVPLTSNINKLSPITVLVNRGKDTGLKKNSVALIKQIRSISIDRILYKHGTVDEKTMDAIIYSIQDMLLN